MLNFSALQSKTTLATVSWRFQALGHWYQPHWWPQSATVLPSEKVEISLRGSVSFPANTRLEARPDCSASASGGTNIYDACSCMGLDL
jgi:hypothetical protein